MNENAGKYAGLTTKQAKKAVVADLEKAGLLEKTEPLSQEVGTCWRCKTPIEILEHEQWFMKTRIFTEQVKKNTLDVTWYPDNMKKRMIDWANSLEWDWVISRQRIFATPIPAWYCKQCNETIIAEPDWVPIDPRNEAPKTGKCPKCGIHRICSRNGRARHVVRLIYYLRGACGLARPKRLAKTVPRRRASVRLRHHTNMGILSDGAQPRTLRPETLQERPH